MRKLEKAIRVHDTMREVDISFSDFLDEFLADTAGSFVPVLSKWIRYSDGQTFGPLRLVQGVISVLERSGSRSARQEFYGGLIRLLDAPLEEEMRKASHVAALRSNALITDPSAVGRNQFKEVHDLVQTHLPISTALARRLCRTWSDTRPEDTRSEEPYPSEAIGASDDNTSDYGVQVVTPDPDARKVAVILSVALNSRSERFNRLQAAIGIMLRLQHAPAGVQTLLNRIGISTSRDTSTRHLGSLQSAAVLKAKDMMEQKERIHVLLFDNLDLYVRSRPGRVTSSNTLVNLTTRTLLQLPSSFDASLVSASALGALDGSRSLNEDEVLGDCDVIRRSAQLFLARELVRSIKAASRKGKRGVDTITMLETYVNQCQDRVRVDELDAEAWDIAPLPLLEENEGCIEGTLAVLEESAVTLGIMERDELSADTNTNDRDDGSNSSCDGFSILRRTDVLPEGALLFVVGDLKSHRNVEAGIKARRHHEHKEERMDYIRSTPAPWHLLLNWVWAIFKMHFSSAKVGFAASLERLRDALRRGKTALREDEPSFNEAWALIRHTFAGWVRQSFVKELSKQRKDISTWTPKDAQSIQMLVDAVREHLFEEAAVREAQFRHDEVGINARLFLRDALLALEWDDACRRGDVGRMLATQRFLAVGFAGAGRHQYSQSCLDDIWTHKVLTEDSWRTLMAVRLLNRYGARNSFIGADLYQEHLNREIQRADIAHGADTAIARLRDTFSATSEVARAMRKAHQDLLGFSGKRWKEDQRYDRDIDRISNLAGQDGLFDSQLNRYSNETVAKLAAKASSFIGPQIPSAEDLLQDLVLPDYGEDALEKGVMYLRSKGYHRWQKLRTAWDRYDAFLGLALEDEETMSDADSTCSHSSNAPGEQRAGDVRTLSEDARSEIARRMRQREWARREEELDAEEAEGPDVISDGQA